MGYLMDRSQAVSFLAEASRVCNAIALSNIVSICKLSNGSSELKIKCVLDGDDFKLLAPLLQKQNLTIVKQSEYILIN
jgi:hypothetical protein